MFTVCIDANDDGTYRVYSETQANEAAEEGQPGMAAPAMPEQAPAMPGAPGPMPPEEPAEASEPNSQTVQTVKEAVTLALEALKNQGSMSDVGAQQTAFDKSFAPRGQA